jgi:hypothetical protein
MARLFLHIGAHKTATSYLQALFYHNRQTLAEAGLHYPVTRPKIPHHDFLTAPWLTPENMPSDYAGEEGAARLWERVVLRPYVGRPGTIFLSAENFSRFHPKRIDMAALARRLEMFDEVRVIYTLRAQPAMLSSIWVQVARNSRAPALRPYVERVLATGMAGSVSLDYLAVYRHLLTGFAPAQIVLFDYDDIRRRPGGVAQAFLDLMEIPLRAEDLVPPPPDAQNISPDALAMWLACQICRDGPLPKALVDLATSVLHPETPRPTTLLSQREYNQTRSKFRTDNTRLVNLVAPIQPGFQFDPPPPPVDMLYRDQIPPNVWPDIAAALWADRPKSSLRGLLSRAVTRISG